MSLQQVMSVGLALHISGAIIWVGSLFFTLVVVHPSARELERASQLSFWHQLLARFFLWGWLGITAVAGSGIAMSSAAFGTHSPAYVQAMMGIAAVALAIYAYLHLVPYTHFRRAISRSDWPAAQRHIMQVPLLVAITLVLTLVTAIIGASGPYFG
jgi:uncharacterized membrane protein